MNSEGYRWPKISFHHTEFDENYFQEASQSLSELLHFPFASREEEGKIDFRYNGAERVDVIRDKIGRVVRCPIRFLDVVKYIEKTHGKPPAIGLRYKNGSVHNYVHFLYEDSNEGWIFLDNKQRLQVRQVHKFERILDHVGLNRLIIIANFLSLPAENEVSRINAERGKILKLMDYNSIHNSRLSDYF